MERWDEHERVRPIPIDDPAGLQQDADRGDVGGDDHTAGVPSRPWLPLLIAALAVAIVAGTLSVYGALRFDEPEPDDPAAFRPVDTDAEGSTTTAAPLAPTLGELLPGLTERLTLVAVQDDAVWSLLWDPDFREPKAVPLELESTPARRVTRASFDRGTRHLAVESCSSEGCDVWIGSSTDLGTAPDIEASVSSIWHSREVGRIAWVTPAVDWKADVDGPYAVFTGTVNPISQAIDDATQEFAMPQPVRLVQWDSRGFVVGIDGSTHETVALSADGEPLWAAAGFASSGTDSVVAILDDAGGWTLVDRMTGATVDAASSAVQLVFVTTSDSADLVARLTERDQGYYSLTVTGGGLSAPRIVTIEQRYAPIGFTDDGAYFLFRDDDETTIFVNWNQGFAREVAAPDGYRIIGLDIG